jgi:hypothetical protein
VLTVYGISLPASWDRCTIYGPRRS